MAVQRATRVAPIPSKLDLILQIQRLSAESFSAMASADAAKRSGDLESARRFYEKHIAAGREELQTTLLHNRAHPQPFDVSPIAQTLVNALLIQADLFDAAGQTQRSEALRNEATAVSKEHLAVTGRADTERSRAASLISQGRFNEALEALVSARELFRAEGDTLQLGRITIDMVDILQWLGDTSRADEELARAIALLPASDQPSSSGSLFDTLKALQTGTQLTRIKLELDYYRGLLAKATGRLEEAQRCFEKVFPAYEQLGVGAGIHYQLAAVLLADGRAAEALAILRRIKPAFTGLLRPKLAAVLKVEADALLAAGNAQEALPTIQRAITDLEQFNDPDLGWRLYRTEGAIFEGLRRFEEALASYRQAAQVVAYLRRAPLGYRLDSTYLRDKMELFQAAIGLAARTNSAAECCWFIEMVKSRTLATVLSLPSKAGATGSKFDSQFDALSRELDQLEYTRREGPAPEIDTQKNSILKQRTELLERLRFSDARWRTLSEPVPFDLNRVLESLATRKQAALSLFYRRNTVVSVLLKDGAVRVSEISILEEVRSKLLEYVHNIHVPSDQEDPLLHDVSLRLGLGAADLLPEELLSAALQAEQLIMVPHGILHLLPWSGMFFKNKRLFEYCPVGILPNLASIVTLAWKFSKQPTLALVAVGDYSHVPGWRSLPNVGTEAETLLSMYGARVKEKVIDSRATEKHFWRLTKQKSAASDILHVASHGTSDAVDPMSSGLLLTDAKIDAAEIARSHLPYGEVVLSGCSTGWRPTEVGNVELSGDDILGLPGAFLEAGVSSVLVSIPPATDDAASEFMERYHKQRSEGNPPLSAFNKAQQMMLSEGEYPPYDWIGFTVYGRT